jgi:hypothetical protein
MIYEILKIGNEKTVFISGHKTYVIEQEMINYVGTIDRHHFKILNNENPNSPALQNNLGLHPFDIFVVFPTSG